MRVRPEVVLFTGTSHLSGWRDCMIDFALELWDLWKHMSFIKAYENYKSICLPWTSTIFLIRHRIDFASESLQIFIMILYFVEIKNKKTSPFLSVLFSCLCSNAQVKKFWNLSTFQFLLFKLEFIFTYCMSLITFNIWLYDYDFQAQVSQ